MGYHGSTVVTIGIVHLVPPIIPSKHRWLAPSTTSTASYYAMSYSSVPRLSVGAISYCWSYSASARFAWVASSNLLPSAQSEAAQIAIISRLPSQSYSLLITIVSNLFSSNQLCHCRLCSQVLQLWAETFPLFIILHRCSSFAQNIESTLPLVCCITCFCSQVLQLWAETVLTFPLFIILHRRSSFALCKIFAYWNVSSMKLFNNICLTWCFLSFVHQLTLWL